ncbi:MAG: gliding motility-associated C-terminal domain-containing protein [Bacteroidetes bacterium]|nr:gliding motility-associated C-terminal domain-containing protein [Bacteroidota bacterium]
MPEANFTATNPVPVNGGFEVQFTNAASSASSYYWDFGDPSSNDNNSSDPDPMHLYAQPGDYTVTLITGSAEGCTDTISKILTVVLNNHLFVPTGFTPNNDGNNDIFRVRGNNISHSEMHIYNQWGQQIWFSLKETTGWDGKMNGETVPNGTYAYMIRVTFDNGTTELLRGNISVIR